MLIRLKTKAEFQKEFPITLQTGKAVGEVVSVAKSLDSDDWFGFGLVKSGAVQIGDSIKVGQAEGEVVK